MRPLGSRALILLASLAPSACGAARGATQTGTRVEAPRSEEPWLVGECREPRLPAVSRDGARVAVHQCDASYDDTYALELRVLDARDGALLESVPLDHGTADESALTDADRDAARSRATEALDRGRFVTMAPFDGAGETPWSEARAGRHALRVTEGGAGLGVLRDDRVLETITLPTVPDRGFCCWGEDRDEPCERRLDVHGAWISEAHHLVALELRSTAGADGCETPSRWLIRRLPD